MHQYEQEHDDGDALKRISRYVDLCDRIVDACSIKQQRRLAHQINPGKTGLIKRTIYGIQDGSPAVSRYLLSSGSSGLPKRANSAKLENYGKLQEKRAQARTNLGMACCRAGCSGL